MIPCCRLLPVPNEHQTHQPAADRKKKKCFCSQLTLMAHILIHSYNLAAVTTDRHNTTTRKKTTKYKRQKVCVCVRETDCEIDR